MHRRSIGTPLVVGIVGVLLLLLLAAGWQVLVLADFEPRLDPRPGLGVTDWIFLVLGTLFFGLVLAGLVWLCVWLVQEMRLNQRQRAFIDAVTHELKTPLASFRLYLDTIASHDLDPERRGTFVARMRDDLERLDHTVDQVLAAARAEERSARPPGRVALAPLLAGCVEDVRERNRLPAEAVRVVREAASVVRGDAAELGIVFRNLLQNAIQYSHDPVEVRVGVRDVGDGRVRVEIEDNGIGIPPTELRKIFQRFYRAGRDVQRRAAGLGLGLFIVRGLLRRQGGRVVAESAGAGQGSRFVVTLRAAPRGEA
ncbi:MAG: HAMP domain-containing sensor histidine kinase [Myxococcota bacterium]|nr:HAMP domain-containing histidine kinase [Myxococcales bacterium]